MPSAPTASPTIAATRGPLRLSASTLSIAGRANWSACCQLSNQLVASAAVTSSPVTTAFARRAGSGHSPVGETTITSTSGRASSLEIGRDSVGCPNTSTRSISPAKELACSNNRYAEITDGPIRARLDGSANNGQLTGLGHQPRGLRRAITGDHHGLRPGRHRRRLARLRRARRSTAQYCVHPATPATQAHPSAPAAPTTGS